MFFKKKNPINKELSLALYEADENKVIDIIENQKVDINNYNEFSTKEPILVQAVNCNSKLHNSKSQLEIVKYLISKNAELNHKTKDGYTALHISLSHHDLSKISLLLIKSNRIEINSLDKNGNNYIFIAIREYRLTWREEQKELNKLRFEIIEELLKRGADIDKINNHGISSRKWLEISDDQKLHDLIKKYIQK